MICLSAQGGSYIEYANRIEITVPASCGDLKALCYDQTDTLNSIKVINKFVASLKKVPQYVSSEIKRNCEAATLKLSSYEWNFDVTACFFTTPDSLANTYYIIPDGKGHWKKTDPRKDRDRVQKVNQNHGGNVLSAIRVLKYWNRRPTMPSMSSYLLENMILDFYDGSTLSLASEFVDLEILKLLAYIRNSIYSPVYDPKGIQGDINNLTFDQRQKIWTRANNDLAKAEEARRLELAGDYKSSIREWQRIFGNEFPNYE